MCQEEGLIKRRRSPDIPHCHSVRWRARPKPRQALLGSGAAGIPGGTARVPRTRSAMPHPAPRPPHLSPPPLSDTPSARPRSAAPMLGRRPRSPSVHAAPWWEPQPGGPGPAKRRRTQEPAGPEHGMVAPGLQGAAEPGAAAALPSVVVLAAGCALQLPLDRGVHLRLQPEPTSVLRVRLGAHTLVLVPEALWGAGGGARSPGGPEPGAHLAAPGGGVAVQQGFFCAFVPEIAVPEIADVPEVAVPEISILEIAVPEIAEVPEVAAAPEIAVPEIAVPEMAFPEVIVPEEAYEEDEASGFLTPWMVDAMGLGTHSPIPIREPWPQAPTPSPVRRAPGPYDSPDFHLWEPFPSSPLQPLPPSPSPGPLVRPRRPLGPPPKARRRLFQE